jgi:protein-S-isoprenylcysteine O-methyltransferase Ste14
VPYVLWLDRHLVNPRDGAWHFGAMLIGREPYDLDEVFAHGRSWAVKGFFTAFMISILPGGFGALVEADLSTLLADPVRFSVLLTELLFVIDVQIGTVGYLLTMKPLDAHIRSANPYLAGWVAALLCYPPFVLMAPGNPLSYQSATADWAFWMKDHTALLWVWGLWLVFLTGVYAWATFAFGIRFSNLTYRGVLTNGPYRFTRHPAYLAKNTYWWCSTLPFLVTSHSLTDMVRNTFFLALTSSIYYWRARTEEKHLMAEDPKYRAYYEWMQQHGVITRALGKVTSLARPRGPRLQPAE